MANTRIGSDKRNDVTKIGQFGVGFKEVFSYTSRPVIHSGGYAFAIEEMFVPQPVTQQGRPSRATVFTFPFDGVDKTADLARAEVEQGRRASTSQHCSSCRTSG